MKQKNRWIKMGHPSPPSFHPSLPNHAPTTKQVHGNFRGNEEVGHGNDQIGRAHGGHAWATHGRSFVRRVGRRRRRRRRCSQGPHLRSRWPAPSSRWPALSITALYMPPRLRQRRGRCQQRRRCWVLACGFWGRRAAAAAAAAAAPALLTRADDAGLAHCLRGKCAGGD